MSARTRRLLTSLSATALLVLAAAFASAPAVAADPDSSPVAAATANRGSRSRAAKRHARVRAACRAKSKSQRRALRKQGRCTARQLARLRKKAQRPSRPATRPGNGNRTGNGNSGNGNSGGNGNSEPRTGEPRTDQPRTGQPRTGEPRTGNPDPGTNNPDPGTNNPNPDPGTNNPDPDPGTGNPDPGTVTPDPGPGAPGGAAGYNGFGVNNWPGGDWRPFSSASPWNQPIGDAPVHPNSAAYVQKVMGWSGKVGSLVTGQSGTSNDWNHPTYYAQPTDPIYTLNASSSRNELQGMRIRVPSEAQAAAGGDGHMAIVQPDGWTYDLWKVTSKPAGGGTLSYTIGGRSRIDGMGTDGRATAANFPNLAGIIRSQELIEGRINHALFVVLRCTTGTTHFGYGAAPAPSSSQGAWVYPASHGGARCDDPNVPPMGSRFQLAMSAAQINALAVPNWKKTILHAMATYGAYVGDTGGPGFALQLESGSTYTSFGVQDPLVSMAKGLNMRAGTGDWANTFAFDVQGGVDWARYLRVVTPPSPGAAASSARLAPRTPTAIAGKRR